MFNLYFKHLINSLAIKASEQPQLLLKPRGCKLLSEPSHSSLFWARCYRCMVPGEWRAFLLFSSVRKRSRHFWYFSPQMVKHGFLGHFNNGKNVDVCVGKTKGIREQTLLLGFEGLRHLNVFDNPVSYLLWRKHLLQLLNSLLQRNTPSPSMTPACLSSDKKYFQNTFLNSLSFHKALCCPSFFRSGGKQKKSPLQIKQ